ncbi:MAG: VWA domain-containing protein, partial [Planctomycetota bacterium]|nr:VWA domain-containing protein [Planctomycetota bacterium]
MAVVDVSASVGDAPPALPSGVRARSHWVLVADGWQEVVGGAEAVRVGRDATRIGAALRHVAETQPGADVLLVTDGRATDGDAEAGARAVAAAGGRVFTVPPEALRTDVGLLSARLVAAAPRARVRAVIHASTSGRCEVRLVRAGRSVDRHAIELDPGLVQAVELEDAAPPAEGATYQVVLAPSAGTPDDDPRDNRLAVGLRPERRVALVWGVPEAREEIAGDGLVVRVARDPDPAQLQGADAVVLANLPWRDVGRDIALALERFVVAGGRLLLLGGPEAYAAGGWAGTPLETNLAPLRVPRKEGTGLALMLAVDRSGSTQGATIAQLKNATRRALQGITPGERMAVLPFAGRPADKLLGPGVVTPGKDETLRAVLDALDGLEARGDTDLPLAIREAARRVHAIEARERRVLLLTDGDPNNPPDADALKDTKLFLQERDVRFGAFVVGDDEAVARLRRHLAAAPEDVTSLEDAAELAGHLLHRVARLRARREIIPVRPTRLSASATPPFSLDGFLPRSVQQLEVAVDRGARTLLRAHYDDVEPRVTPLGAVRTVGAGEVAALAWGPAFEE